MYLFCILYLFIENNVVTTLITERLCWLEDEIKTNSKEIEEVRKQGHYCITNSKLSVSRRILPPQWLLTLIGIYFTVDL